MENTNLRLFKLDLIFLVLDAIAEDRDPLDLLLALRMLQAQLEGEE